MLNEPTTEKLHALRLAAMAHAWIEQNKNPSIASLSFDERFGMLVDAEHMARDNRRLGKLLKDVQLRLPMACIEYVEASVAARAGESDAVSAEQLHLDPRAPQCGAHG